MIIYVGGGNLGSREIKVAKGVRALMKDHSKINVSWLISYFYMKGLTTPGSILKIFKVLN